MTSMQEQAGVMVRSWAGQILLLTMAFVVACRTAPVSPEDSRIADVSAKVAQAAAAVTGQTARIANDHERGKFVGFDTHTYPGTATMKAWLHTPGSPYKWVGYYLPSPCHSGKSWVGKRDTLVNLGWGLAAVYVGQQTWGRTPRNLTSAQRATLRARNDCSTDLLSIEEGYLNADDAIRVAEADGFPRGAVIFLDLERTERIPQAFRDYYRAWARRMLERRVYTPGAYVHHHNAEEIFRDFKAEYMAVGDTSTPRFWIAGGKGFDEGRAPQDVGYAFAGVWQGVLDVARSVAEIRLPVDVNVAAWRSPSESGVIPVPGQTE